MKILPFFAILRTFPNALENVVQKFSGIIERKTTITSMRFPNALDFSGKIGDSYAPQRGILMKSPPYFAILRTFLNALGNVFQEFSGIIEGNTTITSMRFPNALDFSTEIGSPYALSGR